MVLIALAVLLQSGSGQMAPPLIVKPQDSRTVSAPLRAAGDEFELAGRCSRFISPVDMNRLMFAAKGLPKDEPYLMSRIGKGAQHPQSAAWCGARLK